jgi:hypothetical protein
MLPEAGKPLFNFLVRENADAERRLAFDILIERNLGARQQTDRNMRLPDCGEAAGDGILELGRHQLVLDLGSPGRDMVQTVVTHRRHSFRPTCVGAGGKGRSKGSRSIS